MKKISEHLGEIIVALACLAFFISTVMLYRVPVKDFFAGLTDDLGSVSSSVLVAFDNNSGGTGGGTGDGSGETGGESPDDGPVIDPDKDGGTTDDGTDKILITLKYLDGKTPDEVIDYANEELPNPMRGGYVFGGWYKYKYTESTTSTTFSSVDANCPWKQDANGVWYSTNVQGDSYKSTSDMMSAEFTIQEDGDTISFDWWNDGKSGYNSLGVDIYNVETGKYLSGKTSPTSWLCYKSVYPSTTYTTEEIALEKGTYKLLFMFDVNHNTTVETTNKGYVKNIKISHKIYNFNEAFDEKNAVNGMTLMAKWVEPPTLAEDWFTPNKALLNNKPYIESITFSNKLLAQAGNLGIVDSWPAAEDADGDGKNDSTIMCYAYANLTTLNERRIVLVCEDYEKILANPNSSGAFSGFSFDYFKFFNFEMLDTSNVTDMSDMFNGCDSVTTIDFSHFDTSNVTDMSGMFSGCENVSAIDFSHFDTSNVTDMSDMFKGCGANTLDLSDFDTSNVTDMSGMFNGCSTIKNLDLSSFDTSNVTNMTDMFKGCSILQNIYARTEADKAKFESVTTKTVTVKN